MKNISSTYWVLVADSGYARIFALQKEPAEFREVRELVSESRHKTTREIMSDASGRVIDVHGGPSSHTMQPRSDAHELAEQAFSKKLVGVLERAAGNKTFEQLVIFADPRTLGRLRQMMSKALTARIACELNRDLVAMPQDTLEKRVRTELGWS